MATPTLDATEAFVRPSGFLQARPIGTAVLAGEAEELALPDEMDLDDPTASARRRRDRIRHLTRWGRGLGALVLVSAATIFLVQRWDGSGDVQRYLGLLGLTVLLPILGIFCGLRLKESRSARVLFGIAASIVPANFTVLGAFVRSLVPAADGAAVSGVALWQAPGLVSALVLVAAGIVVLVPLSVLAVRTLAREFTVPLSIGFLAGNLALLVPIRSAVFSGALAAALLLALGFLQLRVFGRHPALRTAEGRWARALLAVPAAIVLARQGMLYDLDAAFFALVLFAVGGTALAGARLLEGDRRWAAELLASMPLAGAWIATLLALSPAVTPPDALVVLSSVLPLAALAIAVSFIVRPPARSHYRGVAAALLLIAPALQMALESSAVASLLCLALGAAVAAWAYLEGRGILLISAILVTLVGLATHLYDAIQTYSWIAWAGLAAIGAGLLIVTAILDRARAEA
jgi:hypothetical protein